MIVVVIAEPTPDGARRALRRLGEAPWVGKVMAEVRLDGMDGDPLESLGGAPVPVMATCRRLVDGGRWRGAEEERWRLLSRAFESGVAFVDVEWDVLPHLPWARGERVVASFHDFHATSGEVEHVVARSLEMGVGRVKIATRASDLLDVVRLSRLSRRRGDRVVAFGLGRVGIPSRLLFRRMGSPWVYAAADGSGAELAPGLPSLDELAGTYYDGPSLPEPVAAFGVLGDRASESIGPRVFNRIFHRLRIPALYVPVTTTRLAGLREFMKVLGIRGLSVTTPHKEAVVQAADRLHGLVTRIGASNTLVAEDGGVVAYNTDYHGVLEPVRDACKGQPPKGIACVLGVGGAGRAAACAMQDLGFEVRMWSRRPDRLRAVAGELGVHPMVDGLIPRVIINATPAGGSGAPSVLPDGPFTLAANQVVLEMNYRTDGTPFEHAARAAGASVIPGSVMYASQARWQLHHFWAGLGDVRELMAESVQWAMDGAASC